MKRLPESPYKGLTMAKLFENSPEGRERAYQAALTRGNELWEEHIDWTTDSEPQSDIPIEIGRGLLAVVTQVVHEDPGLMTGEEARTLDDVRVNYGMLRAFTLANVVSFSQIEQPETRTQLGIEDIA